MTRDELLSLPGGEPPCLCADGKLGMLTCFPGSDDRCGVQVHGENEHRWMTTADLSDEGGGALVQAGADLKAIFSAALNPATDPVQKLLAMSWVERRTHHRLG